MAISATARLSPQTSRSLPPRGFAHLSNEAVIALVAKADNEALGELYDRFGEPAYRLAYRIIRDQALAEDAVQEAFLTIWRNASRYIPERAKAQTWIMTLVHRRAVDLVRKEQSRRTDPLLNLDDRPAEGTAADATWLQFERERIQATLRQLSDQQRQALELTYWGGLTQTELAQQLQEPLGTVKSRIFKALARLRELLSEEEDFAT